jgi:hypothetical protein
MFDADVEESINRRCLEEALSVQDMLSPAAGRTSPRRGSELDLVMARLDRFVQGITAVVRQSRFAPMKEADPVR